MNIEIPVGKRIIIIEGVTGSGKTTFRRILRKNITDRPFYEYGEELMLLSWKHIHIPRIASLRLELLHRMLDDFEKQLEEEPEALIVLDRFHLSQKILDWEHDEGFEESYNHLIDRLKQLPVYIFITRLKPEEVEKHVRHHERTGPQWSRFLRKKLVLRGYRDLKKLSIEQQKHYFSLAEEQGIPFAAVDVEMD